VEFVGNEISTEPLPPLQAADALIFSHEAIKTICANHNLHATMYPKPFGELEPTVGLHTHISISRLEKESCFLAGVIDSWAALAAFYMPNYDSNSRLFEDEWVSWGSGDKSKCIRKVNEGHWEFRSVDATSNVYLVLLAIFTAGLAGFEAERQLTVKDPKKCAFKAMSREEASNFGIVDRMPRSLKKAIENLRGDIRLRDALGPELFDRYLYFKIKEEEAFSKMSRNKRRDISMQLF
jgi:glutamine synthetase